MNKIEIQGLNLEVTQSIQGYVNRKLQKAIKYSSEYILGIKANLTCEKDSHLIELIIFLHGGKTLRNATRSEDMYASIDIACDSIDRQLRKIKQRKIDVKKYKSIEEKLNESPSFISAIAV